MERQLLLHRQIDRVLDNFKKLGRKHYTPAIVRSRICHLKELWMRFNDDHALLETTIPETTKVNVSYFSDKIYDKTDDAYNLALDHLAEVLEELEPTPSPTRSVERSYSRPSPSALALSHLPVIQLASFDGNVNEWEPFRDRFTAVIIENKDLHDFARMNYLVSSLRGRALESLSGLAISADNFNVAWQILKDRFDNKRRLISVHMSALLSLPRLSSESSNDLQTLSTKVKLALSSLANLHRNAGELWNDFLVHTVVRSLDPTTRRAWTLRSPDTAEPLSFDALDRFMSERVRALEDISRESSRAPSSRSTCNSRVHSATAGAPSNITCPLCKSHHYLSSCSKFLSGHPGQRRDLVRKHRRCFNCLSPNHSAHECLSKHSCRTCHQRHHSLLHGAADSPSKVPTSATRASTLSNVEENNSERHSLLAAAEALSRTTVVLATARVRVRSTTGRVAVIRALLDQGSEITLVSERISQMLRARHMRMPVSISAVGCVSAGTGRHAVELKISPLSSPSPSFSTTAVVLKALTSYAPRYSISLADLSHLSGLKWADPDPLNRDPIDLIIGADLYGELLCDGVRKGSAGQPIAQKTAFGWIISGPIRNPGVRVLSSCAPIGNGPPRDIVSSSHCLASLEDDIQKFWEVEDVPGSSPRSPEDERCEKHFSTTHTRSSDGRYSVRIPFRDDSPIPIGHSRSRAEHTLVSLLRRLHKDASQLDAYSEFLQEYESLGHMRRANIPTNLITPPVYIPHHPVFRTHNPTLGMRVVFNASSMTTSGTSLNDHILAGPKLQSDLPAVILRWRIFRYVCCADIAKMYRQIRLDERDVDFQRILWSRSLHEKPSEFQLLTVTYGMACAPFLALRVLKQLRLDEGDEFPLAAHVLDNNIYVDDVLFGGDTIDDTFRVRNQLISLLSKGCFPLRKWSSNSRELLAEIPEDNWGPACSKALANDDRVRVLGIIWLPAEDAFGFSVSLQNPPPRSKRAILSTIAKLYDPLGWVTPVVIAAKIFIQSLWRQNLSWDDAISDDLFVRWERTYRGLSLLDGVRVPRWTGFGVDVVGIELHGFADASNAAYAAAVYGKVITSSNIATITLLIGKSRVAPIKPLTVPRLELSAAVMLIRLIDFVRSALSLEKVRCYCWSDSTVVLSWLSQPPSKWKVFVAHRVNYIQTRVPDAQWRYVPTEENPADCASRGMFGGDIQSHSLWWQGPSWLRLSEFHWPNQMSFKTEEATVERKSTTLLVYDQPSTWSMFDRFSSWPKLIRVIAYVFRFIAGCQRASRSVSNNGNSQGCALTAAECSSARLFALKFLQSSSFNTEIRTLAHNKSLPSTSSILALSPFLDNDGLLRVGGRISRSPLPFAIRHPILLASHSLTDLIIDHAHLRALHSGLQLTLNILRRDFWLIRARSLVRHRIHKCVVCTRERSATPTQYMSDLPRLRVSAPSRAFLHIGIDYAGPVMIRASYGRGKPLQKAYIALFVCLASRAIHLELVADYSSQTFVNAFRRFSSRRGLPITIYSDNGTTFVGAERELSNAYCSAIRDPNFLNCIATDRIEWRFIPPSAPHFGGLWEAGVRSVKHHLRRVVKDYKLTAEEFSTLLCSVEACLNSRPIAPLSDELDDYEPLTPGHFLIGSAITAHPEPTVLDLNENRLNRWQLLRHMTERFWHYWYFDYVNLLQQRAKWRKVHPPIKVGQLVIIRNSNLPPCKWELGRVIQCHPGIDGLTRVATIKTASSELKRPLSKLCVLPVDCNPSQDSTAVPDSC